MGNESIDGMNIDLDFESNQIGNLRKKTGLKTMEEIFSKYENGDELCMKMYGMSPKELDQFNLRFPNRFICSGMGSYEAMYAIEDKEIIEKTIKKIKKEYINE